MKSKKEPEKVYIPEVGKRLTIAFFDYPDVFEDFYPHYGVSQQAFSTYWHNTGTHAWLKIVQEEIGDVTWYVLSLKPELNETVHRYTGCLIKFLPSSWLHRKLWKWFYLSENSFKWRRHYRKYATIASYTALLSYAVYNSLEKQKPDVIFVQDYCSGRYDMLLLYAKLMKIPLVTFHTGSLPESYLGRKMKRLTIPAANWIFPSGQSELNRLKNSYHIPASRLSILRPPVDMNIYKPMAWESACLDAGLNINKRYFVFIGRFDDGIKRISSIINVFSILSKKYMNIDLLIIGNGNDEEKLKSQALDAAPDRIRFLGWIAKDQMKAIFINASDCLIMASLREGFPTVIGEAFACGIPVVSSNVGTISDLVIEGKTGWLFPQGNDEAMLNCLLWVADHPQEIKAMKHDIRTLAEETVSFEAITKTLKEGFSSLS